MLWFVNVDDVIWWGSWISALEKAKHMCQQNVNMLLTSVLMGYVCICVRVCVCICVRVCVCICVHAWTVASTAYDGWKRTMSVSKFITLVSSLMTAKSKSESWVYCPQVLSTQSEPQSKSKSSYPQVIVLSSKSESTILKWKSKYTVLKSESTKMQTRLLKCAERDNECHVVTMTVDIRLWLLTETSVVAAMVDTRLWLLTEAVVSSRRRLTLGCDCWPRL